MRRLPWCAVIALAAFAVMLALVLAGVTGTVDGAILAALRRAGRPGAANVPPVLVSGAVGLTMLGAGWARAIVALGGAMLLAIRRGPRPALVLLGAWAGGALVVEAAKRLVGRPRPPLVYHLVPVHQASFPSGHSAGAMLLFPLLGWLAAGRAGAAVGVALAVLIGMTRILLGVHWASDVVGGWMLGGAMALLAGHIAGGRHRRR